MRGLLKPRSEFSKKLRKILGFRPGNEFFYEVAFRHSSSLPDPKFSSREGYHNNQRLELLGDAILGAVCADIIYHSFPSADEGFLSTMRSKIVNRRTLNRISVEMGIDQLLRIEGKKGINAASSIYGDALEALIGAIYLDKGYKYCNRFIKNRLMEPYIDFNELSKSVFSYKGLMLEWAQKHRKKIHYESFEGNSTPKTFDSIISIDGKQQARASGASKKRAEEAAAEKAAKILKITKDKLAPKPKKINIDD